MNLAVWLEKWGRAAPDHPAIALGGTTYATYRQWAARSRTLAGNLRALCKPDDRVAIAMTNRPEFLEALFAIWHAGLVAVPMNAKLHSEEFGYIIGNTDAALVLASSDRAGDVAPHGRTIATDSAEWRRRQSLCRRFPAGFQQHGRSCPTASDHDASAAASGPCRRDCRLAFRR